MTTWTENQAAIIAEHRKCGPVYDGCYAHFPWPHCRADGMALPCDVMRLTETDEQRYGRLRAEEEDAL